MTGAWDVLVDLDGSLFQDKASLATIIVTCLFFVALGHCWVTNKSIFRDAKVNVIFPEKIDRNIAAGIRLTVLYV